MLQDFFVLNNALNLNQYEFRANFSTDLAVRKFTVEILKALESTEVSI